MVTVVLPPVSLPIIVNVAVTSEINCCFAEIWKANPTADIEVAASASPINLGTDGLTPADTAEVTVNEHTSELDSIAVYPSVEFPF